ncbi:MAG: hypothetical protein K9J37_14745 [Saprospiraceae bacterium]|nr:hypothetical protein [Saprospiraceae bacterium]MCF8251166.1 hypothetical protein [Saprospiraceae bacterium]MCF8281889.1 hypothetical protein [Bacteroidales bacterium]MCF8312978.1 hypothetical protein [Saprospiraceae bacterium]MCF8441425.1 hypothetical protein [Saprospiraceae bacterium]
MRNLELQETGQAIYDLANGKAAQLLDYGVKATDLNALSAAVDNYTLLNPKVREVKVDRKTIRELLFKQVGDVNNLLRQKIDNSMKMMAFSELSFFELYSNARRNYSDGIRHEQPKSKSAAMVSKEAVAAYTTEALQAAIGAINAGSNETSEQKHLAPAMNGV